MVANTTTYSITFVVDKYKRCVIRIESDSRQSSRVHSVSPMSDTAGSVTLIFYKIGAEFWKEPFLNLVAAGFQMSSFTHVELAIGARKALSL